MAMMLAAGEPSVSVRPPVPLIEAVRGGRELNVDFVFDNPGPEPWTLVQVRVQAFDASGALALQRFVGRNGVPPGIAVVPQRTVPAKGRLLVFNPLHSFDDAVPMDRLRFEFDLESGEGPETQERTLVLDLAPRPYRPQAELRLPLRGRVLVHDGHDFLAHHRRLDLEHPVVRDKLRATALSGRYACDLVPVDAQGRMHRGHPETASEWVGWEAPVLTPAAGRVVAAVDELADNWDDATKSAVRNPEVTLDRPITALGNHVVIDHGHGEFSLIAHLRRGSLKVKLGDRVAAGQVVGALGLSGDSDLPHVHYQLQSGPSFLDSEGLPSPFVGLRRVLGARTVPWPGGAIDSGDIVEAR
jgi:hypothetical protein